MNRFELSRCAFLLSTLIHDETSHVAYTADNATILACRILLTVVIRHWEAVTKDDIQNMKKSKNNKIQMKIFAFSLFIIFFFDEDKYEDEG